MDSRVKEWLFNLNVLYNHINNALYTHVKLYNSIDTVKQQELLRNTDAVFMTYILIYTNSYLDEWSIYTNKESIKIREACKPVFRYINQKWPGIKKLRDNLLAHNLRNKHNRAIYFIDDEQIKYKVPIDNIEVELLVHLLGLTIEAINNHYKFNLESILADVVFPQQVYSKTSVTESDKIKDQISKQINTIITTKNASES
jgi:hypothetical protein